MKDFLHTIFTVIVAGYLGNRLAHEWQHRSWLNQQRVSALQSDIDDLTKLCGDLASTSGKRLARMNLLLNAIESGKRELVDSRLREYDEVMREWNERLNAFCVRLALYAEYEMALKLEDELHRSFADAGASLERLVRRQRDEASTSKAQLSDARKKLRQLSHELFEFNKELLEELHRKRSRTYYGVKFDFSKENLEHFSSWELFKALFVSREERLSVVRSAADFEFPARNGP